MLPGSPAAGGADARFRAACCGQVSAYSRLYQSSAAYVTEQPDFLNAAVLGTTHLPPMELLAALKAVEAKVVSGPVQRDPAAPPVVRPSSDETPLCCAPGAAQGRKSGGIRFGPRPLDLDIVFYGDQHIDSEVLQVPHPR